jgi:hypothetical protein
VRTSHLRTGALPAHVTMSQERSATFCLGSPT